MAWESAQEIREAVASGRVSARDVTLNTLARIRSLDADLHSFITVDEEHALEQLADLERRAAAGEPPGPLWGVPFSVKDLYNTRGVRTTYGSRVFAEHVPDADAIAVARVRRAGGILVGKTNTPEFGIYIRTVNDLQPETVNPWDRSRTTGGSSGGAAASVAAGLTPVAIGSDGGGSVRIPAALCGVCGLMPSRGSVPRGGGYIGTRCFSSAGPIARRASDALLLWRVMAGPDPSDPLSQLSVQRTFGQDAPGGGRPRLRWVEDSGIPGAEADVIVAARAAAMQLGQVLGVDVDQRAASLQSARFAEDFYAIMQADRVSTGGGELMADPARRSLLTEYSRHQFEMGARVTGADYSRALETRIRAAEHLLALLDSVDVLLTPTLGFVAPEITNAPDALPEDARRGFVAFTFLMNYTGFPAATVPCAVVRGLPVGLQLVGRPGSEERLMRLSQTVQDELCPPSVPAQET
jgi:Asp-tRNA(Asn)/Glu-tRNA(Gln) amidotransferase A subunit family amidase